jgi:enoyl-CoA hydratase/carnithine racemase
MAYETLLYEVAEGVGVVTLNRPDRYNAFNATLCDELSGLWQEIASDDAVRCVVLAAAGEKAFCTGIDRSEIPADGGEFDPETYEDPGAKLGPKSTRCFALRSHDECPLLRRQCPARRVHDRREIR